MALKDTASTLGFLFVDIARLLRRNMDRRLQSLGMTQAQWRAIARLARNEGMTQVDLAESLETQPITVTRLVDRMEKAGWVERRAHPHDRRAVRLFLTPRSQPILAEMHARAAETMSDAMRGVTAHKELLDTLDHIKQNLSDSDSAALSLAPTGLIDGKRKSVKHRTGR